MNRIWAIVLIVALLPPPVATPAPGQPPSGEGAQTRSPHPASGVSLGRLRSLSEVYPHIHARSLGKRSASPSPLQVAGPTFILRAGIEGKTERKLRAGLEEKYIFELEPTLSTLEPPLRDQITKLFIPVFA